MNMISKLRAEVRQHGGAMISAEEYDQLQREWITRCGAEDMVIAEREACAEICEQWNATPGGRLAVEIRARSNVK